MLIVVGFIFFTLDKSYRFETESDLVILADKVGDPVVMTTFRVDPDQYEKEDPNYCSVGGNKLYTPWNVSVFTAASEGDVLRRHHYTSYYRTFGQVILQDCYEMFAPVKLVSLYPDMTMWPFRKGDLTKNDPDYVRISKLLDRGNR